MCVAPKCHISCNTLQQTGVFPFCLWQISSGENLKGSVALCSSIHKHKIELLIWKICYMRGYMTDCQGMVGLDLQEARIVRHAKGWPGPTVSSTCVFLSTAYQKRLNSRRRDVAFSGTRFISRRLRHSRPYFKGFQVVGHIGGEKIEAL